MLPIHESEQLRRNISYFSFSNLEKGGLPYINGKPVNPPTREQLKRKAFNQIYENGFDLIQPSSEKEADCIIRVYYKQHYIFNLLSTWNFYGYQAYTCKTKGFKSLSLYGKKEKYDRNNCTVQIWLNENESVTLSCDYIDFPIKLAKMKM